MNMAGEFGAAPENLLSLPSTDEDDDEVLFICIKCAKLQKCCSLSH